MNSLLLEPQESKKRIAILTQFIQSNPEPRELKRALAVKMALQNQFYALITRILSRHKSCISSWKQKFITQGLAGIKLGYKGATSYLTPFQQKEVSDWLKVVKYWNLEELVSYVEEHYSVIYQSKQSYYALFSAADISWNKSQKVNPLNPELVKKRVGVKDFLAQKQAEIEPGSLVVFFIDECHLLWGDVCGYVWGQKNSRIEVPIQNQTERQTYFGGLNYQTPEFIIHSDSAGNSENTVAFIKALQSQCPRQRIAVIWDGVSYHKSVEMKAFLTQVNYGYEPDRRQVTCILFTPNAPQQNPVEDVWLQAKNLLRF